MSNNLNKEQQPNHQQTEQSEIKTWSDGRLVGAVIQGTEGKPIAYAARPARIELSGAIAKAIDWVWRESSENIEAREQSWQGRVDSIKRMLVPPKSLVVGNPENVKVHFLYALGIHSHVIADTAPSKTDCVNLLMGRNGVQAEIVTTQTAEFILLRTQGTPISTDFTGIIEQLDREFEKVFDEAYELQQKQFLTVLASLDSISDLTSHANLIVEAINQKTVGLNRSIMSFVVQTCAKFKIGLYYSPKNHQFQCVTESGQLDEYIQNLSGKTFIDLDEIPTILRKRRREHNPELKRIVPEQVTAQILELVKTDVDEFLNEDYFLQRLPNKFADLLARMSDKLGKNITEKMVVATILEKGDADIEDEIGLLSFAVPGGLISLMYELEIISRENEQLGAESNNQDIS